ncbi:MAG: branched-chain amino acid ABC transporter permease [Hyphomicrobiales bacterium]|nr:MAG: branched-chain amino acid ABC transporter permease [Hyphomicrobiales bacterium]
MRQERLSLVLSVGLLAGLAVVPLVTAANTVLNFLVFAMILALAAHGWNLLAGYAGQFSFGHAAFFGVGAYGGALLQMRAGINPWVAFLGGIMLAGIVGAVIGALSFRADLRGSYFSLVTLAFAEVLRILVNATPATGGAAGLLIPLDVRFANFQFASRAAFYWIALALVALVTLLMLVIENTRFGAYLTAIRENEDAARALGVDVFAEKIKAMTLSAAITGAAGGLYAQYFLYLDANIGFGPWISIEALVAPIIGGLGTAAGPLVGALALQMLGEMSKTVAGRIPGIDLVLFGLLLVLVIAFMRRGVVGQLQRLAMARGGA